jgi:hypothetical protein
MMEIRTKQGVLDTVSLGTTPHIATDETVEHSHQKESENVALPASV